MHILQDHGLITEEIKNHFFDDPRCNCVRGTDDDGNPVALLGSSDADQLLDTRHIQNVKILFCKLKKSPTAGCAKTVLPVLSDFHEDGTKLLCPPAKVSHDVHVFG